MSGKANEVILARYSCMQVFSSCSELGLLFVAMLGLLIAVVSLVVEYRLYTSELQ